MVSFFVLGAREILHMHRRTPWVQKAGDGHQAICLAIFLPRHLELDSNLAEGYVHILERVVRQINQRCKTR